MDLFTPIINEDKWHPYFKIILHEAYEWNRDVLAAWACGFQDRDNKFVKEFQATFNSCLWELYLHAILKDYNLKIDWSQNAPDFIIESRMQNFNIEASTANAAQDKTNEWEKYPTSEEIGAIDLNELNREAIIRLSNTIHNKHMLFTSRYKELDHVKNRPFLIAVAPFEQPLFNMQHDRPIRALLYDYYVNEEECIKNPDRFPNGPVAYKLEVVNKDNGAPIELGLFNCDDMAGISAIVFSCTATMGKLTALSKDKNPNILFQAIRADGPNGESIVYRKEKKDYKEMLVDGLQIYHNPYATHPFSPDVFRREGVVQHYYDHATNAWIYEGTRGCLRWRHVLRLNLKNE